ncbi:glutathione S-transferase 1-like [Thrips palmi]|uniref:Glutathione S-transferase 1-like n=1 Tax=Thrips palmi TaxID=161013 RepID=A0A6P8Y3T5_THRPL|nr:glutathione S-transferase 1-like [Thrips palmi]XP_034234172.1 glutathione S-transferase 1-like [Thrips palmi]XP_034234173.1 glutathione S-transferase 1-like [Thrips palmi]XP_034234174.1 glutathione S-transferase 1-like [Thrips palmi]
MGKVTLYGFDASPPFRAAKMSCAALGVEYTVKYVDVTQMENRRPEYLKLNPIHTVPTMVDGDYVLFDSHAISCYLANKYGKDDKWYPKDPCQRGIVDQRLHFDCSVLGIALRNVGVPLLFGKQPNEKTIAPLVKAVKSLDKLLGDNEFIALNHPTIADCHCSATVLSIQALLPNAVTSRVAAWLERCKTALPGFEKINNPALEQLQTLREMGRSKL